MNTIAKLSLTAAALAAFAGSVAHAGDPTPRWQNELQRQNQTERRETTTVAIYYAKGGLGQSTAQNRRLDPRWEDRQNAHGQSTGAYTPAR